MTLIECNTTPHVSIFWMVAYYWIEILPEDYIIDVSPNGDGSVCMLQFRANIYDFIVLGTPILQNYYVTFDMENTTATFIPNAWTKKGYLELDRTLPSRKIDVGASSTQAADGSSYGANSTTKITDTVEV